MAAPVPANLQDALAQIAQMNGHGNRIQNELAVANQQLAAAEVARQVAAVAAAAALAAAAARAPAPKIPTPRVFDGKVGASIDVWVDEMEMQHHHYAAHFATEQVKLNMAACFVTREAQIWMAAAIADADANGVAIDTWAKLVIAMRTRYQPVESSMSARASLDTAVQSGSVQAYSAHVLSLLTYIKDMSDADQVHQYCRGLKPAVRIEVIKSKPKSITVAIEKATGIEAYSRMAPQASSSSSYRPNQHRQSYGHSSSSSAPMDVNNIETEAQPSEYLDASPPRESHWRSVVQQQRDNMESMQQQLNALYKKSQDSRSTQSRSSSGKVEGISRADYQRCRDEGRCLKCREVGHIASACTKPLRLNW